MLSYLALLLIVFLGVFIGLLISYMAKEELKPGAKYFNILKHAVFLAILVVFFVKNPSIMFVLVIAAIIIAFSFSKHWETLYYYALGIIFFLSWKYNGFSLLAPLMFLYGLPLGSLYLFHHIKEKKKKIILGLLRQYVGFFIVGLILGIIGLFL